MDVTIEPDADARIALKLQTDECEVNVYASADDLLRLRDIRTARWGERQSIQAGESAGAHVYWASVGTHAALMIGHDDETWDVSVALPFALVDEIVREVAALS